MLGREEISVGKENRENGYSTRSIGGALEEEEG